MSLHPHVHRHHLLKIGVDRLFSQLKAIGAVIVSEPRNYPEYIPQPYCAGSFKDLDGIKYEIVCTRAE